MGNKTNLRQQPSPAAGEIFGNPLQRPAFRSDLLYFIRLAGNYACSIFRDTRERAQSKHRKQFAEWLAANVADKDDKLWRALVHNERWFDTLKADFPRMIEDMPDAMRNRLDRVVQQDHALPLDLRNFTACLDDLREARGWLEHYDERRAKGDAGRITDERLLRILGLMLLPFMGNHLLGRMRHHARRSGFRRVTEPVNRAKAILESALADRREASRHINGLKRKNDHETIRRHIMQNYGNAPGDQAVHRIAKEEAKKRRDLESRKAALIELHRRYFPDNLWPRYNYENFLIRFAFIGRGRIGEMEALLGGERHDFIQAIEPLFMLSMDVALVLHGWLAELEAAGVPVRTRKKVGAVVPALRNALAHGGWFWKVDDPDTPGTSVPFGRILDEMLALPAQFGITEPKRWRNDLLARIEAELRPCGWHRVYRLPQADEDPNRMPAPHVIRRWTVDQRTRFADRTLWRIEKRPALRRLAAGWIRDIQAAQARKI